jgi:hypothetical protein
MSPGNRIIDRIVDQFVDRTVDDKPRPLLLAVGSSGWAQERRRRRNQKLKRRMFLGVLALVLAYSIAMAVLR